MKFNEKVLELVNTLYNNDHETIFAALMIYEANDYKADAMNLIDKDFEEMHKLYNKYMECDYITGLINNDILELIEEEKNGDECE